MFSITAAYGLRTGLYVTVTFEPTDKWCQNRLCSDKLSSSNFVHSNRTIGNQLSDPTSCFSVDARPWHPIQTNSGAQLHNRSTSWDFAYFKARLWTHLDHISWNVFTIEHLVIPFSISGDRNDDQPHYLLNEIVHYLGERSTFCIKHQAIKATKPIWSHDLHISVYSHCIFASLLSLRSLSSCLGKFTHLFTIGREGHVEDSSRPQSPHLAEALEPSHRSSRPTSLSHISPGLLHCGSLLRN